MAIRQSRLKGAGVGAWSRAHGEALNHAWSAVCQRPFSSLLTILVLAVSLSLPAGLYVLVGNINTATEPLGSSGRLSVFLALDASDEDADRIAGQLSALPELVAIEAVSPDSGLAQFAESAGLDDVVSSLDDNPLPWLVQARLRDPELALDAVDQLLAEIRRLNAVEEVIFDREWLLRLQAFVAMIEAAVDILSLFLALTVILLIGNTLRVEIESRRQEIEVQKLIGATDAFIARPFLYLGLAYGLLGGLLATALVQLCVIILRSPVATLADSYGGHFQLTGLGAFGSLALLASGMLLGLFGALLTVRRETSRIEPDSI